MNEKFNKKYSREEVPDFVTYSRQFEGYKWYKPILEIGLSAIFWYFATFVCIVISFCIVVFDGVTPVEYLENMKNGYDSLDMYTFPGTLTSLLGLACIIPGSFLATKIVKSRPFHSVASSCGGFSIKIMLKAMIPAFIVIGIPVIFATYNRAGGYSGIQFTVMGFIACIILGPLQCIGEEFMFRGLGLQAVGSWTKIPLVAIIAQALVFASLHSYNIFGVIEVTISGLVMGILTYYTKGIEASSAQHIVNNMILFIMNGFGFQTISSNGTTLSDVFFALITESLYLALIIFLGKKYNWFERTPKETDIIKD